MCSTASNELIAGVVLGTDIQIMCMCVTAHTKSITFVTPFILLSGYGDLSFNLMAYGCGTASNFTQALYLLLVQRFTQHHKLTTTETLQLNCINSLPILILAAVINGEFATVWKYPFVENPFFPVVFFFTISVGMMLNYSLFLCTGLTSALTTSVVGGLKAMVQTMLGLVTFGGVSHNLPTYLGIALNLVGGVGYITVKYRENNKELRKSIHKVMSFSSLSEKRPSDKDHHSDAGNGSVLQGYKGSAAT